MGGGRLLDIARNVPSRREGRYATQKKIGGETVELEKDKQVCVIMQRVRRKTTAING